MSDLKMGEGPYFAFIRPYHLTSLEVPLTCARAVLHGKADMVEAIEMFARLEGILLDPVYSGKGAAGLIDLIRTGHFKRGETVVFLHTGGSAGLFGYTGIFDFGAEAVEAA